MSDPTHGWSHAISYLTENPLTDFVVQSQRLSVGIAYDEKTKRRKLILDAPQAFSDMAICTYALKMMCNRLGISARYAVSLRKEKGDWADELLVDNLNMLLYHRTKDRNWLLRSSNDILLGFLSDSYKCLDTLTLVDQFAKCAKEVGALPSMGIVTPLRAIVSVITPHEIKIDKRIVKAGMILENSEVGAASANIRFCVQIGRNTIINPKGVVRRHRGRKRTAADHERLKDEDSTKFASDIREQTLTHLTKGNITALLAEIALSEKINVDPERLSEILVGIGLDEDEIKETSRLFSSPSNDLPPKQSMFRLANAVAWLADVAKDDERKIELLTAAGSLIMKG